MTLTALILHHPDARPPSEVVSFPDSTTAGFVALDHDEYASASADYLAASSGLPVATLTYRRDTFATALHEPGMPPGDQATDAWKMVVFAHPEADRSADAVCAALMRYIAAEGGDLVQHKVLR